VTLRSIAVSAFLPAVVFEIGNGAIAPIIALTALDLGASVGTAGYMLALLAVGQVLGDVPAASIADRLGDRRAMMLAAGAAVLALFSCFIAPSLVLLGLSLLVMGACTATYYLARQSYLTDVIPPALRARALSTLGGSHRIGLFIGPFIGAAAISIGGMRSAYVVAMVAVTAAGLIVFLVPDVSKRPGQAPRSRVTMSVRDMINAHRRLFATLGVAVLAVGAVRAARQTVVPLWAEHIGLSAASTSVVFGIASAVDMALFYPAGKIMDHFGRLAVALPAMTILGISMMLLPLTSGAVTRTIVAMIMSLGNGIGSGIIMTLGADAAPVESRIRFLSIWRVASDSGGAAGPVLVSVVATLWTLAAGIIAVGSVGLLAAAALGRWAPRYSAFATVAMARNRRQATLVDSLSVSKLE
jgi:MFS family permease